jgi:oligopeptide/dipeptide ABC transporter ATP-binding protein
MTDPAVSPNRDAEPLLEVEGLRIELTVRGRGPVPITRDVSLRVYQKEIVGLIGESGSGKSVIAKSLIGMLPRRIRVSAGTSRFQGRDLFALNAHAMRAVRGAEISLIPQDALHALNPVKLVGKQVGEPIEVHTNTPAAEVHKQVVQLLNRVHISDPEARTQDYPHQFSGGMQQRALTAMALSMKPPLILADEPTTALDVTIQGEILKLIRELRSDTGASFLFISHDLGLVSSLCDRIYVMYAGEIVESGTRDEIFSNPRHPYTRGLIGSVPRLRNNAARLLTIPGRIPGPGDEIEGCRFRPRCPMAEGRCIVSPSLEASKGGHAAKCWLF